MRLFCKYVLNYQPKNIYALHILVSFLNISTVCYKQNSCMRKMASVSCYAHKTYPFQFVVENVSKICVIYIVFYKNTPEIHPLNPQARLSFFRRLLWMEIFFCDICFASSFLYFLYQYLHT